MKKPPVCPYCGKRSLRVTGARIYPNRLDLVAKCFYLCSPCGAWVGCHPGSAVPLGRLASAELRREKQAAHRAFDPIWKSGRMTRTEAYHWLSEKLGISKENTHIGMFDVERCRAVVAICAEISLTKERNHVPSSSSVHSVQ